MFLPAITFVGLILVVSGSGDSDDALEQWVMSSHLWEDQGIMSGDINLSQQETIELAEYLIEELAELEHRSGDGTYQDEANMELTNKPDLATGMVHVKDSPTSGDLVEVLSGEDVLLGAIPQGEMSTKASASNPKIEMMDPEENSLVNEEIDALTDNVIEFFDRNEDIETHEPNQAGEVGSAENLGMFLQNTLTTADPQEEVVDMEVVDVLDPRVEMQDPGNIPNMDSEEREALIKDLLEIIRRDEANLGRNPHMDGGVEAFIDSALASTGQNGQARKELSLAYGMDFEDNLETLLNNMPASSEFEEITDVAAD